MIKLTSNLINETIVLQPSVQHMLPDKEHMSQMMDTAVNNFYSVGRTYIAKQVRGEILAGIGINLSDQSAVSDDYIAKI